MCIIIYSPNGTIPAKHLSQSFVRNRDGWGYVFASGISGKLIARHGMTQAEFWSRWKRDTAARKERPVIFHARIGTSGTLDVSNCHPFPVPGHRMWLAHNGVIKAYHPEADSEDAHLNDTRLFIRDVLSGLPPRWHLNESIRKLVEHTVGASKIAVMDRTGGVVILNEWLGHWHRGRWYSNHSYLPTGGQTADPRARPAQAVLFGSVPCVDDGDCEVSADSLTDEELASILDGDDQDMIDLENRLDREGGDDEERRGQLGMPDFDPQRRGGA